MLYLKEENVEFCLRIPGVSISFTETEKSNDITPVVLKWILLGIWKLIITSRQLFGGLQIISQFLTQRRCTPQPLHWYNTIYCLEFFNNWSSNDKAMIASFASWYLTRVSPWNLKEIGIQLNWTYQQRGQSLLTNAQKFVLVTTASVAWVVLFLMIVW